jgi:hypothetical protein
MTTKTKLSWSDRFALIDHYKPTDERITTAFGVTQAELDTARTMRSDGTFTASKDLDVGSYDTVFSDSAPATVAETVTSTKKPSKAAAKTSTKTESAPETATKKTSPPKKRGRKGTKIHEAFRSIPTSPTSVDDFAKKYGISIPVLRQSKRFDTARELGTVRVKRNKTNGLLEIWREAATA